MASIMLTVAPLLMLLGTAGSPAVPPNSVRSGAWLITWSETEAIARHVSDQRTVTIFSNSHENCCTWSDTGSACPDGWFLRSTGRVTSVIGSIVSFSSGYEGSGGMHPIYGSSYQTVDLDTGAPADITQIASEASVLRALRAAPQIREHLEGGSAESLDELIEALGLPCETDFSKLRSAFRLLGVQRSTMVIEFGLGHGCEVMRGRTTKIEIKVPIPRSVRARARVAGRALGRYPAEDPYVPEPECAKAPEPRP